ncbi:unnamed protein product [Cyclocybe aegerita]|uniref:Uncharacterized protein n=1 Tax=Cyclocybe aegerita TaxID=1973307 RepID=A0A8S0VTK6_CYCAE|nr:unnamed protein product [Cyclocybe aegerita]
MPTITPNGRVLRPVILVLGCLTFLGYYTYLTSRPPTALYNDLFTSEDEASRKFIHNELGSKYVKFKQLQGAGFNNQAQEILLYHHLALQTSRIYVYQPFIWRPRGEKAEVPLSAFLRGPTEGTISDSAFDEVCPPEDVVRVKLVTNTESQWEHAKSILNSNDRCIVVEDWLFNWNYLASTGIHDIWPSFQKYLANHFKWSDNVLAIVDRTQTKLGLKSRGAPSSSQGSPYIAVHLRRGDFEDHCKYLNTTHQGFTTWGSLPLLRPATYPPALNTTDAASIMEHCYPSLHRILDAISKQARSRGNVRAIHILHDGAWDHPTVYLQFYKLSQALTNERWTTQHGWVGGPMLRVTQSADVPMERGERDWRVCVDVELARRAEVFIGNGYSSLSTQVVALRLGGDGGKVEDITLI